MPHFPQSALDIRPFQALNRRRGDFVLWQEAVPCPCGGDIGHGRMDCQACFNGGVIYPHAARKIRVILTDMTGDMKLMIVGVSAKGDLLMALPPPPPLYKIRQLDRIVPVHYEDGQPFMGETVMRQDPGPDKLGWAPHSVDACMSVDPLTGVVTAYTETVDFTLDRHLLTWVSGHGPLPGEHYTMKYQPIYEYVVLIPPNLRYERKTDFGTRVVLRKRQVLLDQLHAGEDVTVVVP